jgi:hypothetical protein
MAYIINKTDGTAITTITDGTVDNTTSLQLFGKSYSGFGEGLNENLVKLLENSASTSAPAAPLKGELWFDTTTNQIKVYDGTSFKPTGGAKVASTQPSSPSAGDLWQDSTNSQLYIYTGSAWLLVGPVYTSGQTLSGWKIETINDNVGSSKVISSMYAGNTRVAVLSKETFTPASLAGFATISAGLTLNSTLGASFSGNSSQASAVDVSSTTNTSASIIAGGNFLRADASDTTTGALTIDNNSGITIGDGQELSVTVASNNVTIAQTSQDKDLSVTVNDNGSTVTAIKIDGSESRIGIFNSSPTVPLDVTGATNITGNVTITGNLSVSGEYNNTSSSINVIDDAFVKLNSGNSEVDAGLIVETSDTDDARLFYDVSENYWSAGENASYSQIIRLADATTDGHANASKVLKVDGSGQVKVTTLTLGAVGSFTLSSTGVTTVPSTGAVATLMAAQQPLWGSSAKYVSTVAPTSGDGADGDFWFVREA